MPRKKLLEIPQPYTNPDIPIPNTNNKCIVSSCYNDYYGIIDFYRDKINKEQGFKFCEQHMKQVGEIVLNEIQIFIREGK